MPNKIRKPTILALERCQEPIALVQLLAGGLQSVPPVEPKKRCQRRHPDTNGADNTHRAELNFRDLEFATLFSVPFAVKVS
jgi:hypothetical protein